MNNPIKTINLDTINSTNLLPSVKVEYLENITARYKTINNSIKNFIIFKTNCRLSQGVPYKLDHYAITLCLRGSCQKTMGHHSFKIAAGTLHITYPGMISVFDNASDDLELYIVLFTKKFIDDLYLREGVIEPMLNTNVDFPPLAHLDGNNFKSILGLFEQMSNEYIKEESFHVQIIQTLLMQLFYLCGRLFKDYPHEEHIKLSRSHHIAQLFKQNVDKLFIEKRTIQEYADLLNISPKHLGEIVKQETNESALKIIHERIYNEALYMLNYTAMSIKEISEYLNFDTPSHFTRFFKQIAGYTPTAFKKAV
ncbi:helix-turn-helix domain-containing protein [Arachidicoccus sp.]|jgi:AraC-like DNA-binding protein|uniref:helix-turn-helix domain-containing protein n=1 Tax=Arachidicoccus sp. TaxID=1872624 RepID=UPI003D1B54E2